MLADKLARSENSEQMQYLDWAFCNRGGNCLSTSSLLQPCLAEQDNPRLVDDFLVGGITARFYHQERFLLYKGILSIGAFVALGFIICSILFGFSLGLVFASVMVLFAAGSVLYTTSNILHHYAPNQHVAASLALFSSVALLFFYILQVLMSLAGGADD